MKVGDFEHLLFVSHKKRKLSTLKDYEQKKKGLNVLKRFKSSFRYSPFFLYVIIFLLEKYPSPAEGIGLENRQGVKAAGVQIPLPPPYKGPLAQLVRAHAC